jgi:hypothetical protein
MRLLFCSDPLTPNQPDFAWQAEVDAAKDAGFAISLIDFEALLDGNLVRAVRKVAPAEVSETALLRGWMLRPEIYTQLFQALQERNIVLINSPEAYTYCHYLPESYAFVEEYTPRTVWMPMKGDLDMDAVMLLIAHFGEKPLILKDYVKSAKHAWLEASFIPSASDRTAVEQVVRKFLSIQGNELNVGLVFREYSELKKHEDTVHPFEFRLFFLDNELLCVSDYWETENAVLDEAVLKPFLAIAKTIPSRFFSLDIAQCADGSWTIIELGDGQVSGLPDSLVPDIFYRKLLDHERLPTKII